MTLEQERIVWREQMEKGEFIEPYYLDLYRRERNSSLWRSTRAVEKLCEYILFLEGKLSKA